MFQMRFFCALLCFSIIWAEDTGTFEEHGGGVRGPRIVEHKAQSHCRDDKSWPVCTDDEWGSKCPSGCRMQGLIDETDKDFGDRIKKIKKLIADNQNSYKSSSLVRQEITTYLDKNIVSEQQAGDNYGQISDELRRRLVLLKQQVADQVNRIRLLQNSIQSQVGELKRLEVDVDIKIRACKGSCTRAYDYQVDNESYDLIQRQLTQVSSINLQPEVQAQPMKVLKMRPLKDSTVPGHFKTAPLTEQEANILDRLKLIEVVTEDSGAESRGPTVDTKFVVSGTGAAGQPHTSKQVIPGSRRETSILSVEQPHVTHASRTCMKTITKKVTHGPDGPREEVIEEYKSSDGSDCSYLLSAAKGTGSSYHVSSSGGGTGSSPSFASAREFFTSSTGGGSHSTGSSSRRVIFEGSDAFSELGEGEEEDFSSFDHPSPEFHSSRTSSRTVVSSSSSSRSSSFNKGGSTFEIKSIKGPGPFQHESGEDAPDFRARSLGAGPMKLGESYTGTDCVDIHQKHTSGANSGIFRIKPAGAAKVFSVYCDQEDVLGGWLLIQQRLDGSLNFNRTWEDYKKGFGSVDGKGQGEFWLGNENLHILTQKDTVLRIQLEDWEGNEAYAEYNIRIGSESEGYILRVSGYSGTAGDALIIGSEEEGSEYTAHANMKFSTFDRDNDQWEENCAENYGGGWWYNNCQAANLNGIYYTGGQYDPRNNIPYEMENGVVWVPFKPSDYSLKTVRMKIRPLETD
ncbi:fibrinogen alpha chain [Tiliqua scincoides]|uniref:fibrinogen alpha chain n=1 Tax=Tiliqua scincoides TaxID=71010 RepID=UPI003463713F